MTRKVLIEILVLAVISAATMMVPILLPQVFHIESPFSIPLYNWLIGVAAIIGWETLFRNLLVPSFNTLKAGAKKVLSLRVVMKKDEATAA